jgi:phosphatidylglycerophosphatase A
MSLILLLVGTVFGIGRIPGAPGTYASAFAALSFYAVARFGGRIAGELHLSAVCLLAIIGVFAATEVSRRRKCEDPSEVVIDEVAGQVLTYLFVPVSLANLIAGLVLFRIFDIWKPFPARQAERLEGGVGIMADDLVAGLYANLSLQLLIRLLPH